LTKGCRVAWLAGLVLGGLGVLGAQSGPLNEPPPESRLQIIFRKPAQKPPVWFSHRLHESRRVDCQKCHHRYEGRRNLWQRGQPVEKCSACHGLFPQGRRPDLKNAFHRQCKGCHLKLRQQGRKAGPIECVNCHRQT
jgi:hypothetical protein